MIANHSTPLLHTRTRTQNTRMPTNDKENQRPKIAIVAEGQELTEDERLTALQHCPAIRMGRVRGTWGDWVSDGVLAGKYVIFPDDCIGCGICVRKVGGGKLEMMEW